uniref:Glucosamine 6-phosphate N-acetyltransferase n=1 Tax=Dermatophagoides pteronyssinus TaxID=6956 RepID=A0A6P6YG78_DERPT|nr:glucosamine 6-phosphate N-acetyltransferase-like [Dermatophagoides pteronyssinus]
MIVVINIYDEKILDEAYKIDSKVSIKDNFRIRPLAQNDYEYGFLTVLSQLTEVGDVSRERFDEIFDKMKTNGCYYVTVIEDLETNQIAGSATLFTEYKFIHGGGLRARIEDVVVDNKYRGQNLGVALVQTLKSLSKVLNCYKLTLDCNDRMISWYQKYFAFQIEEGRSNFLTIRF